MPADIDKSKVIVRKNYTDALNLQIHNIMKKAIIDYLKDMPSGASLTTIHTYLKAQGYDRTMNDVLGNLKNLVAANNLTQIQGDYLYLID